MNSELKNSSLNYMSETSLPLPASSSVKTNKFDDKKLMAINGCIEDKMEGTLINHIAQDLHFKNKMYKNTYFKLNDKKIIYEVQDSKSGLVSAVLELMEQYRIEYTQLYGNNIIKKETDKINMTIKMLEAQGLSKEIVKTFLKSLGKSGTNEWKKYTLSNKCESLTKVVELKLIDEIFSKELNCKKFQLPIANNKIIDLQYKKPYIRPRGQPYLIQSCLSPDEKNLNPYQKADFFSYYLDVNYIKRDDKNKNQFELIDKYILDLATGNKDKAKFLKTILGSILIKGNPSQKFFLFTGAGSNGKSMLINIINSIFQDLKIDISADLLIDQKGKTKSGADPFLIEMNDPKIRLMLLSETKEGINFDDALIKRLTGDDNIKARALYSNKTEQFKVDAMMFIISNHRPKFNVYDYGMKRRPNAVDFNSTFVKNPTKEGEYKKDPTLFDKLTKNKDIIFSWFVEGAMLYKDNPMLDAPDIIQKETENYFYELDSVAQYLEPSSERVILTDSTKDKIQQNELFNDYILFCKENNLTFSKKSNFYTVLSKKLEKKKLRGSMHFCKIKWADDCEEDETIEDII